MTQALRMALILALIALRPVLLLLLWPIVTLARLFSALGAVSCVAGIVLVLHTSDPKMVSLGWLWIAFLPAFSLLAAALKGLQWRLRTDAAMRLRESVLGLRH